MHLLSCEDLLLSVLYESGLDVFDFWSVMTLLKMMSWAEEGNCYLKPKLEQKQHCMTNNLKDQFRYSVDIHDE